MEAAGTDATQPVMEKMRSTPINDFFVKDGKIREDGRMVHEMYLYEVKKPAESKGGMGLLRACRHDPGGPGISAVVGIQMPASEEGAVSVDRWCGRITQPLQSARTCKRRSRWRGTATKLA